MKDQDLRKSTVHTNPRPKTPPPSIPRTKPTNALDVQVGGGHYKTMAIQPVEFCFKNKLNNCQSNIIKYVTRYNTKNGIEDLKKAKHYIDLLIELEYGAK